MITTALQKLRKFSLLFSHFANVGSSFPSILNPRVRILSTHPIYTLIFSMGHTLSIFCLFSSFQTSITIFTANKCEKLFLQYMGLGFKHTTFGTWVSSHNHQTRAPALPIYFFFSYSFLSISSVFVSLSLTLLDSFTQHCIFICISLYLFHSFLSPFSVSIFLVLFLLFLSLYSHYILPSFSLSM